MRNLADPTAVGSRIDYLRMTHPDLPLHECADKIAWESLRQYAPNDSIAAEAHRKYHDELQQRARAGDHHAKNLLLGLNPNDGAEE